MNGISKIILALTAGFTLSGCVSHTKKNSQPDPAAIEAAKLAQYTDSQLCQAEDNIEPLLNLNPSSHPEFNENYRRAQAIKKVIASRNLSCYHLKMEKAEQATPARPLSPRQKQARASAVCQAYTQRTRFADPTVTFQMCGKGFQSTSAKCKEDLASFERESQKLRGAARAEYVEISSAFRAGCTLK